MKHIPNFLAGIFCLFSFAIAAQTLELENRFLDNAYANGRINKKNMENRKATIGKMLDTPDYPSASYDTVTGNFNFRFSVAAPGSTPADLYAKVQEWAAATFIRENTGVSFRDSLNGKIIVKGYNDLRVQSNNLFPTWKTVECRFALVLQLKNGLVEGQFKSIEFADFRSFNTADNQNIIPYMREFSTLFPLSSSWFNLQENVNIVKATAAELKKTEQNLGRHLAGETR